MATKQYERPREGAAIAREVGGKVAPAGLWRHPQSGQEAIVQEDPLFGNAQAQAFLQTGFEYIRPAEPGEVKTLPELAADTRNEQESNVKGLAARLDLLEDANAKNAKALEDASSENAALAEDNRKLREQLAEAQKTESAEKGKATKKAKADRKEAVKTQEHIESANTDADPAKESGDKAKTDAERVVADRDGEGKAPESGNAAAPGSDSAEE
jgi:regulator of replication initiation timing